MDLIVLNTISPSYTEVFQSVIAVWGFLFLTIFIEEIVMILGLRNEKLNDQTLAKITVLVVTGNIITFFVGMILYMIFFAIPI